MVDPITGIDINQAQLADIVNRQNVGASQRARNELIRKQTQQGKSPDLSSLYSTTQGNQSEFPNYAPTALPELSTDVFGHTIQKPYEYSPGFSSDDPYIRSLNSKYKYNMPDLQPTAYIEGGPGWDITKGKYGSWDLGNQLALIPKQDERYLLDSNNPLQDGSQGFLQQHYSKQASPFTDSGEFNPEGWQVASTKSNALGGILGTLSVLAAPVAAYYGATPATSATGDAAATGTAGTLGSGESMFFGGTDAIAPTVTSQSSGMFGNKAWDLGSKYANKAAEGALKGFIFSGGDPKAALQGGITGPLASYTSDSLNPYVGNIASKALGGAASNALASLFTKNSPIAGSLYGGMSGGLNAYLNSVNANADPFNKTVSNTLAGITRKKLFGNK